MRAITAYGAGDLRLEEIDQSDPSPGGVAVQLRRSACTVILEFGTASWSRGAELVGRRCRHPAVPGMGHQPVRQLHDALESWQPPENASWTEELAGPRGGPMIAHADICPENVITCDGKAVAIIDWESAAPGRRIWDFVSTARRAVGARFVRGRVARGEAAFKELWDNPGAKPGCWWNAAGSATFRSTWHCTDRVSVDDMVSYPA